MKTKILRTYKQHVYFIYAYFDVHTVVYYVYQYIKIIKLYNINIL